MSKKDNQKNKREFESIVHSCQRKVEKITSSKNISSVFDVLVRYINKHIKGKEQREPVYIEEFTKEFLQKTSTSKVGLYMIEYRLSGLLNSQSYGISHVYKEVLEMHASGKIDLNDTSECEIDYSFNTQEDLKKLVIINLKCLRKEQRAVMEALKGDMKEAFDLLKYQSKNQRTKFFKKLVDRCNQKIRDNINDIADTNIEEVNKDFMIQNLEYMFEIYLTINNKEKEKEMLKEKISSFVSESSKNLKQECIRDIRLCIEYLDEFGFLEHYIKANNSKFKSIFGKDILNFDYDSIKAKLTEEELSKLNIDQLIVLGAFWINRVNKIIKELNTSLYMISDKKLYDVGIDENGDLIINVNKETQKNILLKMAVVHRMFEKVLLEVDENGVEIGDSISAKEQIDVICERYGREYEEYFNKLLGEGRDSYGKSSNSLERDLALSFVSENAVRNSYTLKNFYIQSLLFSLLSNKSKLVENYGYIQETPGEDIRNKKMILIGVDLKGFNMPFRLHVDKDMLLDVLRETQEGCTKFPIYEGAYDFYTPDLRNISAQILVPLSSEEEKRVNDLYESFISKYDYDANNPMKSGNVYLPLVMHLNFLTSSGKVPEHLIQDSASAKNKKKKAKFKQRFIELDPDNTEKVK